MRMPRTPANGDEFKPYSPAATLPYAHRWRLFRTPNDAFLTATPTAKARRFRHPAAGLCRALQRGVHPTAEAHAIVADHVVRHVRKIVDKRDPQQDRLESRAR